MLQTLANRKMRAVHSDVIAELDLPRFERGPTTAARRVGHSAASENLSVSLPHTDHELDGVRANSSRYGPSTSRSIRPRTHAGLRECSRRGSMMAWRTSRALRFGSPRVASRHTSLLARVQ